MIPLVSGTESIGGVSLVFCFFDLSRFLSKTSSRMVRITFFQNFDIYFFLAVFIAYPHMPPIAAMAPDRIVPSIPLLNAMTSITVIAIIAHTGTIIFDIVYAYRVLARNFHNSL